MVVSTLFSDEFIMFTDHDHRYGDEFIVPGVSGRCVLKQSLNYRLTAVRRIVLKKPSSNIRKVGLPR